jgi:redox-sensitive bicupin YhaK (pirin superfamily)
MSGEIDTTDLAVYPSRESVVGRMTVHRALPRRGLRTVGPWCFADHMGPELVTETQGLDIGPHPHTGLHTVTWLLEGAVLHRDSLGTEQLIRPGQLNLMTAGHGVAHAEEATDTYRGTLHGVQLWVAQPDGQRDAAPGFEHHAVLPRAEVGHSEVTVLVGEFAGATSLARQDSPIVGADAVVRPGTTTWPLRPDFEYALLVLAGEISVGRNVVRPHELAALGAGRDEVPVTARETARVLLLGGAPFTEPLIMWWNFVARTHDEIDAAVQAWQEGGERFGQVDSALPRIPAPQPIWAPRG